MSTLFIVLHLSVVCSALEQTALAPRHKRQYYICGTYPNQFYSLYPCGVYNQPGTQPQNPNQCSNGGRKIGVGCYYDYQCTPYSGGQQTRCISNCCCTVPVPTPAPTQFPPTLFPPTTPSVAALAYCYNGQRTQVRCTTSSDCSAGQTCVNAVCCTTVGNEFSGACGGLAALASCQSTQPKCGSFVCTTSNYCCECQYGRTSGSCANGCPPGYTCGSSGYCCASCPSGRPPFGSCFNGLCANGYSCQAGNICC